jgi:hypothetical protein
VDHLLDGKIFYSSFGGIIAIVTRRGVFDFRRIRSISEVSPIIEEWLMSY